jgi:hypothetical protein
MTVHNLTNLVRAAHAGHPEAGLALAYTLSGIICLTMHDVEFDHFVCDKKNDFRKLRWAVVGKEGMVRVSLLNRGKIKFSLQDRRGERGTRLVYDSIYSMIEQFRSIAEEAKAAAQDTAKSVRK